MVLSPTDVIGTLQVAMKRVTVILHRHNGHGEIGDAG
jgi:hypothetical protein